ncbi:hypothetical protein [Kitasatospora sp. NPDC056181]|uniref:hypothetical protein n=1 Tax=Kitasatospora sp. NPDC056181 TaxID=3345737 RepID=UPI0035E32A47
MAFLFVVEGTAAAYKLGPAPTWCLIAVTAVLGGAGFLLTFRSWTTVGAEGITICWGIGRGRTYPWKEIRWIDVRDGSTAKETSRVVRMFLASGRRRSLPGLMHSDTYPSPDFDEQFHRVVNWWELSTDPADRVQPQKQARDRLTPTVVGIVLGLLITVVVGLVVLSQS